MYYINHDDLNKENIKKSIMTRIKKIEHDILTLYELRIDPNDDDDTPVQIRYDSGETVLLETLKNAHKKWEMTKNSDNTIWKISWYNKENNYRIVYNEEENKWDNITIDNIYIRSYTLEEFKEFCESN